MTHTTQDWHNSPLPEGATRTVTVPPVRGGWALWRGTDRQRPWWSRELRRPWRCRELRRPWQVVLMAVVSSHSTRPLWPELYPPPPPPPQKKNPWGSLRGFRSPPGLSSGTGALLGLNSEAEVLTGHAGAPQPSLGWNVESGALTGYAQQPLPSPRQERQAAGNGLRGHNQRSLPQTSLHGPDRQDKINLKLFLRMMQDLKWHSWPEQGNWILWNRERHSWPWLRNWIHGNWRAAAGGLDVAAAGGLNFKTAGGFERAAAGRLDIGTVSGLERATAGGLEWASALISPRTAAGLRELRTAVLISPQTAGSREPQPAAREHDFGAVCELDWQTDGGLDRWSADRLDWWSTCRLEWAAAGGLNFVAAGELDWQAAGELDRWAASGLAAIPPNSHTE